MEAAKPHDVHAYSPELMTGDVIAVLDDVHVEQAAFWGYSMGGRIGFLLTKYHPARFSAYIIGGMSPFLYWETLIGQKGTPHLLLVSI